MQKNILWILNTLPVGLLRNIQPGMRIRDKPSFTYLATLSHPKGGAPLNNARIEAFSAFVIVVYQLFTISKKPQNRAEKYYRF